MDQETALSVVLNKFGGYDSFSVRQYPLPSLKGNVEVRVEYAGVNFADLYARQGLVFNKELPFVLGMECTGTVIAIGTENTTLKVGQNVICYDYTGGMYSQVIRVPPEKCFPLAEDVSLKEGAALFVNYMTAHFSLFEIGNLRENETVLIMSCAGGVGCAATQLAKIVDGVKVVGTGSLSKEKEAKYNGVDIFLNRQSFQDDIKTVCPNGVDLILSNELGDIFDVLLKLLRPLGRIVVLGANNMVKNYNELNMEGLVENVSLNSLITNNTIVGGFHLGMMAENDLKRVQNVLADVIDLYRRNKVKPIIHSTWPMTEIVGATKVLMERKNVGKVLIYMGKQNKL